MRRLKNAQISFISLVSRGANRIPFRILKSEGENQMLDLTQLRHVFKGETAQTKPTTKGFAAILKADPFRTSKAPQTVAKAAPAPRQTVQQSQQRQQLTEERQRQGLAPNQAPAPRRASNTPKVPTPSRDTVTLQSLKTEIDCALAEQRKREKAEAWNESRSAFSQISPTRQDQVKRAGAGDAWALRNRGGQLAVQLLGGTDKRLPTNTAFRAFSGETSKA